MLSNLMTELGPTFRLDPQIRFETVTGTTCHIIDAGGGFFRVELFQLSNDPFDRQRFARRRQISVLGRVAYAATAEDVTVMKLRWSGQGRRPKDREDERNLIMSQGDLLDWEYIHRWCDQHGTRQLLEEIHRSIPPI